MESIENFTWLNQPQVIFPDSDIRCDSLPHRCYAEKAVNCFLCQCPRPPTINP